jgi:5-methylcytosine-specific restriction endonuclease McrA
MTSYQAYLQSWAWRSNPVKLREMEASGFQCRLCTHSAADGYLLEVHHRTYERLGSEVDGDLTTLCSECHEGVTSMLRARRYAALPPTRPSDFVPTVIDPQPLFDQTNQRVKP